ncbi:hypothetical protein DV737_g5447, partial [Chaetothyriales sp. CBS 132003]
MSAAPLPSDEVAEDYRTSLEDLISNDRYQISTLTLIAKENVEHAEAISRVLQNHIARTPPSRKLPALYVLDSVVKNVGSPYNVYFGRNLYQTFMGAYSQVDEKQQPQYATQPYSYAQPQTTQQAPAPVLTTNLAELLRQHAEQVKTHPTIYPGPYTQPAPAVRASSEVKTTAEPPIIAALRAQGLLAATPTPPQMLTPPPGGFAVLAGPSIGVTFTSAFIKIAQPQMVASFLSAKPNQCSTCGRRFTSDEQGREKKARHLDWHFKTKTRMMEAEKRGQNRSWYVDEREWIGSREQDDDVPEQANGVSLAQKKKADDFVRVPSDPALRNASCPIDQEPFQSEWSEELQDFIWKDAMKVGNKYYHASCFEEVTKNREKEGGNLASEGSGVRITTPDSVLGKRKAKQEANGAKSRIKRMLLGEELSISLLPPVGANQQNCRSVGGVESTDAVKLAGEDLEDNEGEGKLRQRRPDVGALEGALGRANLDQFVIGEVNGARAVEAKMEVVFRVTRLQAVTADSCWVILYGVVWDVTSFLPSHPGGTNIILKLAGRDATEEYDPIHPPGTLEESLSESCRLGRVDPETVPRARDADKEISAHAEQDVEVAMENVLNVDEIEEAAAKKLSKKAWAYYYSASDDLRSKALNNTVYSGILLRPRVFVDCSRCEPRTTFLGHQLDIPIYVSPAAMARLAHADGEWGIAQACRRFGAMQVISNNASMTPEQIVKDAGPGQVFGWQLYVQKERKKSEDMIARINKLDAIKFICLTLDAPVPGKREDDERSKNVVEDRDKDIKDAGGTKLQGGGGIGKSLFFGTDPSLTWKETLPWLRQHTTKPIVLKGLQSHEDAFMAAQHSEQVKGIILSNHGGRALDTAPPAVHTLLEIRKYCPEVFDKIDVIVDGGIKRGTDVVKALCLGAKAVGVGRAALYGLGAGGVAGVERVLEILKAETETAMRLLGVEYVSQLGMQHVNARAVERDIYDGPARLPGERQRLSKL